MSGSRGILKGQRKIDQSLLTVRDLESKVLFRYVSVAHIGVEMGQLVGGGVAIAYNNRCAKNKVMCLEKRRFILPI